MCHILHVAVNGCINCSVRLRLLLHCLQVILPEVKTSSLHLRQKGHVFDLPRCTLEIHKKIVFATVFV